MELDGRYLGNGAVLEADVCVVGAGPAGLALACALAAGSRDVLVLESGGAGSERSAQRLNEGATVGDAYAGLRATRHRQIGGAANLWNTLVGSAAGAKYVPLDRADLAGAPELPWSGWPLPWSRARAVVRRGAALCGLHAFDGDPTSRASAGRQPLDLDGGSLETRVYELGVARPFAEEHPERLRRAPNVRLCHHATVCRLVPDRQGERVEEALVASIAGTRFRVRADVFVLAAGAIENARTLLLSDAGAERPWLGPASDWVGRCFMEHPRDYALTLVPRPGLFDDAGFYDSHVTSDGSHVLGRIALAEELRRHERLPNVSVTLVPRLTRRRRPRLPAVARRYPRPGTHWSRGRGADGSSAPLHDAFTLLLNLEQPPHGENRVVLGTRRDALGLPAAELHWRWRPEDHDGLARTRAVVARAFEATGLGRVEIGSLRPDPNAHHHSGTTRMSLDAGSGVVNPDGRVHGTENLYACGASVFPTAGFANPTLTVVALALRLGVQLGGDSTTCSTETT